VVLRALGGEFDDFGQRVRGLKGGDNAFELRTELEGVKRLLVGCREIGDPATSLSQECSGPTPG
jgi:hypothetical protein